jgi:hypothetical protein
MGLTRVVSALLTQANSEVLTSIKLVIARDSAIIAVGVAR